MLARVLIIDKKVKQTPYQIVSLKDFRFSEGDTLNAHIVIEDPNISLYCLDDETQSAIFTETPAQVNLYRDPFYYQAQYENAIRLLAVPYERLFQLSNDLRIEDERLILIYSVARCGSTLVSSAFSQINDVVSLSEPDVYSQLVIMRNLGLASDAEISNLLQACTKVLCKRPTHQHVPSGWALKFRGLGIELADLFYEHFPRAKIIFLYRNAETWCESYARAFGLLHPAAEQNIAKLREAWKPLAPFLSLGTIENLSVVGLSLLIWLRIMDTYMQLACKGIPMLAVRFEDLTGAPEQVIEAVLKYCHMSVADLAKVNDALRKDSQAGTVLSQANVRQRTVDLTEQHLVDINEVLQEHPTIQTPNFTVPNTLQM
jgi:hypothetical protein